MRVGGRVRASVVLMTASALAVGAFGVIADVEPAQAESLGKVLFTAGSAPEPTVYGQPRDFGATTIDKSTSCQAFFDCDKPAGTVGYYDAGTTSPFFSFAFDAAVECSDFYPGHCEGIRTFAGVPAGTYDVTARYTGPFDPASYPVGPVTVVRAATHVTVSVPLTSPTEYGQGLTILATVVPDQAPRTDLGAVLPTGGISLYDGDELLETKALDSGGFAGFIANGVDAGPHSFTAQYNGDGNYQPSSSSPHPHTVTPLDTTTTLWSSPNPSEFGQDVTFTAEVKGPYASLPAPGGTVTFRVAGSDATVPVSGGRATLVTNAIAVGGHAVAAVYNGETNYRRSTASSTQLVAKATSAVELTTSPSPSTWGAPVTLTARLSPGSNTGTVTFLDGDTQLGTAPIDLEGDAGSVATLVTGSLTVGDHELRASYAGDDSHLPATGQAGHTVAPAPLTITASDGRTTYGQPPPPVSPEYSGFVNGEGPQSLDVLATCTTIATATSPAGNYPSTCSGAASGKYTIDYASGTVVVDKAPLTVRADDKRRFYSQANPPLTYAFEGFVTGDTAGSALTGAPVLSTTATPLSDSGRYPISIDRGRLAAANYEFTLVGGTLEITPAPTTLRAHAPFSLGPPGLSILLRPQRVSAELSSLGQPLPGRAVVFSAGSTTLCSATTVADGTAECTISAGGLLAMLANRGYTASFAGSPNHQPSTDTVGLVAIG